MEGTIAAIAKTVNPDQLFILVCFALVFVRDYYKDKALAAPLLALIEEVRELLGRHKKGDE